MASSLTIIPGAAGTGDQDANLLADGQILFADPDIGGNTLSAGALASIAADVDITVESLGDITFRDLGGVVQLHTATGHTASFSTSMDGGGDITFDNVGNTLATNGGDFNFDARDELRPARLNSIGGNITGRSGGDLNVWGIAGETLLDAGTGSINLTAGSIGTDSCISIKSAGLRGTGGLTLTADHIAIGNGQRIDAGSARVILRPFEDGTKINLGLTDAPNTLGLTNHELALTAGSVQIGDGDEGDIRIWFPISPQVVRNLLLQTAGGIIDQMLARSRTFNLPAISPCEPVPASALRTTLIST